MYFKLAIQLGVVFMVHSSTVQPTKEDCNSCCTGATGTHGIPGYPGPDGPKGDVGLKGDKGNKGDPGDMGPRGLKGDTGSKGERGIYGPPGKRGAKGEQATNRNKSAFSVAFKTSPNRPELAPLKYDTIYTNVGNHYSAETGKFVCEYPGFYVFYFASQKSSSSGEMSTVIVKNGEHTVTSHESDGDDSHSISNMVILNLITGDEVWTEPNLSPENHHYSNTNAMCTFSGFLLYEL